MNKDAQKTARTETGAAPAVTDLRTRVPQMADDALVSLRVNALRLSESGSALQRVAATQLLPVVDAEIAERKAAKKAAAPPKAPRVSKKKAAPKPEKEDKDGADEQSAGDTAELGEEN